mmetsp:Transcript_36571/g.117920  ORF Transcript_36571/g.117920 Transcript_36571/m.117920 type:complete len:317 (+) Transcript_36571:193-1143(+)
MRPHGTRGTHSSNPSPHSLQTLMSRSHHPPRTAGASLDLRCERLAHSTHRLEHLGHVRQQPRRMTSASRVHRSSRHKQPPQRVVGSERERQKGSGPPLEGDGVAAVPVVKEQGEVAVLAPQRPHVLEDRDAAGLEVSKRAALGGALGGALQAELGVRHARRVEPQQRVELVEWRLKDAQRRRGDLRLGGQPRATVTVAHEHAVGARLVRATAAVSPGGVAHGPLQASESRGSQPLHTPHRRHRRPSRTPRRAAWRGIGGDPDRRAAAFAAARRLKGALRRRAPLGADTIVEPDQQRLGVEVMRLEQPQRAEEAEER